MQNAIWRSSKSKKLGTTSIFILVFYSLRSPIFRKYRIERFATFKLDEYVKNDIYLNYLLSVFLRLHHIFVVSIDGVTLQKSDDHAIKIDEEE